MRFRQVVQLFHAATQSNAKNLTAPESDQRVRQLVSLVQCVIFLPGVQVSEVALTPELGQCDDGHEYRHQHRADAAEPDRVDTPQEQDAHGDADDHAEGAQIRLQQQQQADEANRRRHRHETFGQLVHIFLLAHGVVGGVQHGHYLHQFGRLQVDHLQRQPATAAVDHYAQAGNQHQYQQHQRADEQVRRGLLQIGDANAEHEQAGQQRDHDEQGLARQEVGVLPAHIVGELG